MSSAAAPPGSVCQTHPEAPAVSACDRCGNFVCDGCRVFYDYRPLCPDCFDRRTHRAPASGRARWAMVLGVLGLALVVLPFGVPAVILGHTELAAINAGTAPEGGRGYARAGILLGWLANVFFVTMILVLGFLVWTIAVLGESF